MQKSSKDIILLSILAMLWAAQGAMVLQQFLGLWHAPLFLKDSLLPEEMARMAPKWDLAIYIFFIATALIAGQILFRFYRKPINYSLFAFEVAVTFLMASALFKIMVYDNSPELAQRCLTVLIIISAVCKIFYPEIKKSFTTLYRRAGAMAWGRYADAWWVGVVVLLIYMPHLESVMALAFIGDWLHHFDFMLMSVGWASLWGQIPYVDVISQYGMGLPVIFAKITQVLGGFGYVQELRVIMWFVIIYFILTYFFVRYWLKDALIAGVAFLLIFRLQMFHYGVSPLVWITPSASPVRFGLDILWMAALLLHMRTDRRRWLILAALYSGFSVYYMTSVGMCMMAAFYAYLLAMAFFKRQFNYFAWLLPLVSMLVLFAAALGGHIFQKGYWHNLIDYMVVFGHTGAIPMWESLKYRHFWAFFMSMALPLTYLVTFLFIGARLYIEKGPWEESLVAILCIYGLANYQYYVVRSAITSYYVNALPFVFVSCFWFMRCLQFVPVSWRKGIRGAAVILSFYALLTNQNYLAYPNLINPSANPVTDNLVIQRFPDRQGFFNNQYRKVKEADKLPVNDLGGTDEDMRTEDDFSSDTALVDYFRSHFDFFKDAALIDSLTSTDKRVPLISSFETKILIQANRPPFFYHFPLLSSRPMSFRNFPGDAAHTPAYIPDTLGALESKRPEYVFMERILLRDDWPASYQESDKRVMAVIAYVKFHYKPFKQGQYLVAMKRIL